MKRILYSPLALVVAVCTVFSIAGPASAGDDYGTSGGSSGGYESTTPYYVSMGDSLAVGIQPVGPAGANVPTADAFPNKVLPALRRSRPGLKLQNFGCPGAGVSSVLTGGDLAACGYGAGTQLSTTVAFIKTHKVADFSIILGSNDVIGRCVTPAGIDGVCAQLAIAALPAALGSVLDQVNAVLPAKAARAGGLYYDPYLGLALDPAKLPQAMLSLQLTNALNDALRAIYRSHGFTVAQVGFTFRINDYRTTIAPPTPNNVVVNCALTWFCTAGNIHPNTAGYTKIAEAFKFALKTWRRS